MKKRRMAIYIDEEFFNQIDSLAKEKNTTLTELNNELLRIGIKKYAFYFKNPIYKKEGLSSAALAAYGSIFMCELLLSTGFSREEVENIQQRAHYRLSELLDIDNEEERQKS